MSDNFVDIDFTVQPEELADVATSALADSGWTVEPADPEDTLINGLAQIASYLSDSVGQVPASVFRKFGTDLLGVPYQPAEPATASVSVSTPEEVAGTDVTIPAGTQFELGSGFYFENPADIVIPVGQQTVSAQTLDAILPGADANGLTGAAQPVSQLADIQSVTIQGTTSGGADAEDDDAYMDRLRSMLSLLAPRPITATDFAVFVRSHPDVQVGRSVAIDGWDAVAGTGSHARTVTVFVTGEDGLALSAGDKTALTTYLNDHRELNFLVYVRDASYTTVNVEYQIHAYPGFDTTALLAAVDAALADFLSPRTFGTPGVPQGTLSPEWSVETKVRLNKVIGVIEAVAGVDYAVSGSVKLNTVAADLTMSGAAPLPALGTITRSAV